MKFSSQGQYNKQPSHTYNMKAFLKGLGLSNESLNQEYNFIVNMNEDDEVVKENPEIM
jgi:hypothetical protein